MLDKGTYVNEEMLYLSSIGEDDGADEFLISQEEMVYRNILIT